MKKSQLAWSRIAPRIRLEQLTRDGNVDVYLDGEHVGTVHRIYTGRHSSNWRAYRVGNPEPADDEQQRTDAVRGLVRRVLAGREEPECRA